MKPDSQWGANLSTAEAYRILTVRDAKHKGSTAGDVLESLVGMVAMMPVDDGTKRTAFEEWLAAVRKVYGNRATGKALEVAMRRVPRV